MEPVVFTRRPTQIPALFTAVVQGETDNVLRLLDTGVDIHEEITFTCKIGTAQTISETTTAVHTATIIGQSEILDIFLQKGIDVNSKTQGNTMLHNAVLNRNDSCVLSLIRHRADISTKNLFGHTALDLARHFHHHAIEAIVSAEELARDKCVAFAMGHHARLGKESIMARVDPEVLRMVLARVGA